MTKINLKESYELARCCNPELSNKITGYFSHDSILKVHKVDCANLAKTDQSRLVSLNWNDIIADSSPVPDEDYNELDSIDFKVLAHHDDFGIDYSLVVARQTGISKDEAFKRHTKLRTLGLIERVDATIIRYRKGIVDNKWIKHRNHTYYGLTDKGNFYLGYNRKSKIEP